MEKKKEAGVGMKAHYGERPENKLDGYTERTRTVPRILLGSGARFRRVQFYGAEGCLVLENDGHLWVDLEGICQELGLDLEAHCAGIRKVPDFKLRIFVCDDPLLGEFESPCLAADQIGAWIFMIDPGLVAADARSVLSIYRRGLQRAVNDFCQALKLEAAVVTKESVRIRLMELIEANSKILALCSKLIFEEQQRHREIV